MADGSLPEQTPAPIPANVESDRRHATIQARVDIVKEAILSYGIKVPESCLNDKHFWFNTFQSYTQNEADIRELINNVSHKIDPEKNKHEKRRALGKIAVREAEKISKIESRAGLDSLTKLPNRGVLDLRVAQLQNWVRNDSTNDSIVVIILMDIDEFKIINDTLGHPMGDEVLRLFADAAKRNVKEELDTVGRFGGEEFLFLLPMSRKSLELAAGEDSLTQAIRKRAEAIRQNIIKGMGISLGGDKSLNPTVSAGVALIDPEADLVTVYEEVDKLLYVAKNGGRNRLCTIDDLKKD